MAKGRRGTTVNDGVDTLRHTMPDFFGFDTGKVNVASSSADSEQRKPEVSSVVKQEWGAKRTCSSCGARFYDLRRQPIVCPVCSTVFDPERQPRARRGGAAREDALPAKVTVKANVVDVDTDETVDGEESDDLEDADDVELENVEDKPAAKKKGAVAKNLTDDDDSGDDDNDNDLIEDTSELGEDDDDIGEVMEHIDDEQDDKP
jgi:uncharacterized protein (TIGR02300 family)